MRLLAGGVNEAERRSAGVHTMTPDRLSAVEPDDLTQTQVRLQHRVSCRYERQVVALRQAQARDNVASSKRRQLARSPIDLDRGAPGFQTIKSWIRMRSGSRR